ncbi:MAG: hypothetical protein JO166_23340 [Deltaproteobacteria bacterium]|nr:hypothetical protein [Deltaproteobacteria bacterium]
MSVSEYEADPGRWFFENVVEPTVKQFREKPDDMRLGCLACIVLSSMVEHYYHAHRQEFGTQTAQTFRRSLAKLPLAEIVFDVANATKHVVADRKRPYGFRSVESMELDADTYKPHENEAPVDLGDLKQPIGPHVMVPAGQRSLLYSVGSSRGRP